MRRAGDVFVTLLALAAAGCHESSGPRKITQTREITVQPGRETLGATGKERFDVSSMGGPHGGGGSQEPPIEFDWDMPDGWSQLPTREMHLLDMKAGPDPDVECSLSVAGGGLLENINRWRKQFGQPPVDAAALAKLPKQPLLQREAVRVEVEGAYTGMGATAAKDGYKLIGLVAGNAEQQVFVKLTGPKAAVDKQAAALDDFAASLRVREDATADAHGGGAAGGASGAGDRSDEFDYALPTGWTKQGADAMRIVNLRPADDPELECYFSIARGGVLQNVNRWRNQFGAPPIDDAALAKLPTLPLFGVNAVRVEVDGTFKTMSGEQRDGFALEGLVADAGGQQIFVKMTGPKEKVEKERAAFVAFATSLHWKGGTMENGGAPSGAAKNGGAAPAAGGGDESGLQYDAPAGWKKLAPKPMRVATFAIGASGQTECALVQLGGDGGGVAQNVNRWRDQMGLAPAKPSELLQLPTLHVLGVEAPLVDLAGHFQDSMTKRDIDRARFLGLIVTNGDGTLFVKLTGPETEVAAAFDDFRSFCQSLRR